MNDDYIIELAGIKDYPALIKINSSKTCNKILKSSYISDCKIRKRFGFVLDIELEENRAVFFDANQNKYIFANQNSVGEDEISYEFRVPRLLNYVPDKKFNKFILGMSNVE